MKYKPYPQYKKSEIPGLGEMPEMWKAKGLRYILQLRYGDPLPTEIRDEGRIEVFGSNGKVGTHTRANTKAPVIIIGRKGSFGKVNYSENPVHAIDTTYYVDSRFTKEDLKWLKYALQTLNLDFLSKDSTVPGIAKEDIYDKKLPVPPIVEQHAIAAFLDRETVRIKNLIEKKQLLIKKLTEKRRALILSVVQRGLPPEKAPDFGLTPHTVFKETGIADINEIPEEWTIRKLSTLSQLKSGIGITSEDIAEGGDIPVYGGNGIRGYYNRYTHNGAYILIGRQGALCGNIHLVSGKFWASEHTFIVTPIAKYEIRWLAAQLEALNLNDLSTAAAQPGLTGEQIGAIRIPFPPLQEQCAIADFLDVETAQIDHFVEKIEEAILKIQEYSKILVDATISGKIDVRGCGCSCKTIPDCECSSEVENNFVSECFLPVEEQKVA